MRKGNPMLAWLAVVGVAVVIAAIAWPAWRIHTTRTRVADAFKAVDAAKLVVMEAATVHGGLDHIRQADLPAPQSSSLASPYAATVKIIDGGRITLTTKNTGASATPVLQFVPSANRSSDDSSITWRCVVLAGDASLAPEACRAGAAGPDAAQAASAQKPASGSTR